jgi:CRP/FNR family cyclic AMP-dependent transcriptional regulator
VSRFDMAPWMSNEARAEFARLVTRRSYSAGQTVYSQDDDGVEMYRIASGSVRLFSRQLDGREAVFLFFGENDFFGVSSLVDDGPRPQTAECLSTVEIDVLPVLAFDTLRSHHPSFSDAMLRLLAKQMRLVSSHYARATMVALPGRIAERLLELAAPDSTDSESGYLFVRLHQEELAAMVGASRQSVNKILQTFQRNGVIQVQSRVIKIYDISALMRITMMD